MTRQTLLRKPALRWKTWMIAAILAVIAIFGVLDITAEDAYAGEYPGTVYFSLTDDGKPVISDGEISGKTMFQVEAPLQEVADINLAEWGLEKFSYTDYTTGDPDPDCPTLLKLYLYALEHYKADPTSNETFAASGSPHSFFMTKFWGHDCNLLYYVNGTYPLFESGWGATADGVILEPNDFVDVAMFTNWGFYGDPNAGFNYFADENGEIVQEYEATAGEELPLYVIRGMGNINGGQDTSYTTADDLTIHVSGCDEEPSLDDEEVGTLKGGSISLTFDKPGTYYVWAEGGKGDSGDAVSSGVAARVIVTGGPQNVLPINYSTTNGSIDTLTITDSSGNVIENAEYEVIPGSSAGDYTVNVTLPKSFGITGSVKAVFARTPNAEDIPFVTPNNAFNRAYSQKTDTYSATLSSGRATTKAYVYNAKPKATSNSYRTISINYAIANAKPTLANGVSAEVNQTITAGDMYTVDLSTIFTDNDGDDLSYKVSINGAAAISANTDYSFTTDQKGTYKLIFTANDGVGDSEDKYTVNLTVERRSGTHYITHTNGTGYSTEAAEGSSSPVDDGNSYTVKLNITQGYQRGADFAVKAGDTVLEEDSPGSNTFTIPSVKSDLDITVTGIEEKLPVIIAPAGSTITVGYQTGYFKKTWIDPQKTETLEDGRVKNSYSSVSNAQLFYRVQNPDGVTYYKFIKALNRGDEIEVTADKLFINDDSFNKGSRRGRDGNIADVYLPINAKGYVNMAPGAESTLNCFRNWLPVNSTISNDKEGIPDFHYEAVDENGDPSELVTIVPDKYNSGVSKLIAGNGTGMAIVKVTYDAMYVDGNNNFGPKFGAIWPERTGVFVVTVGEDGTGIATNMKIDQTDGSARNIDAEHDPLFYVGNEGASYSFTPESGTTVTVARPLVTETSLTYTGFSPEGVTVDNEGKVTVTGLVNGRNIVKIEKDGVATYQVLTAQQMSYTLKDSSSNAIEENGKVKPGDKVTLALSGLTSPSEKFSGKYNYNFRVGLKDESGNLLQEASPGSFGVYNFTTKDHDVSVTIPADWEKPEYKISTGGIIKSGFAGGDGTHRTSSYGAGGSMAWGAEGTGASSYGNIPELTIKVQQPPVRKEGVEAQVEANATEGEAYELDLAEIFEDPNGDDLTYTVSVNSVDPVETPADPVAADEKYSFTPDAPGTVILIFRANDGTADSNDTYIVKLNVAPHTHELIPHEAVEATCTEGGNSAYWSCSKCSKFFSDAEGNQEIEDNGWVIQAKGHDWNEPEWTWNEEDYSEAKARFTCKNDSEHVEEKDANVTSAKDSEGNRVYTATVEFNEKTYTNEKIKQIEETKASVDFTSQKSGKFLHSPKFGTEVSSKLAESYGYTDDVDDGVSVLDVLVAAHKLVYGGDFTADTAQDYLTMDRNSPSKQFGVSSSEAYGGFFLNRAMANDGTMYDQYNWNGTLVGTQKAVDKDFIEFYFYEDPYWGDSYNWFVDADENYSRTFNACVQSDLELGLKGFYAMSASIFKDAEEMTSSDIPEYVEGAQICTVNLETGAVTTIEDAVTDEDGMVTLNFDEAGTYTIAAYGTDDCMYTQIMSLTTINVREHEWDDGVITPGKTCDDPGVVKYTCKHDPSHTYTEATTPGHTWKKEAQIDREATCTEPGQKSIHCEVCDAIDPDTIEEIQPIGHEWSIFDGFIWKGNETDGYTEARAYYECKHNEDHLKKVAAEITEKVIPPSCEEGGKTTYTATISADNAPDGEMRTEAKSAKKTEALGHEYGAWKKLNDKQHQRVCKHDGSHVQKANHTWDKGKVTKKATEKAAGVKTYTCTVCKATRTETIPKLKPKDITGTVTILNTIANSAKKTNDVIWDKSKVKGATNYEINWRAKGASKWASTTVGNTVRGTTTGLSIKGLYEIRVRPKNASKTGAWSNTVYRYFHTTEKIRLASNSKGSFTMSWKNNPEATGYQVMFTTNKNGSGAANNINTVGKSATSFTKSGLKSGVTYYVQVREIKKVGNNTYIGNISIPVEVKVK